VTAVDEDRRVIAVSWARLVAREKWARRENQENAVPVGPKVLKESQDHLDPWA